MCILFWFRGFEVLGLRMEGRVGKVLLFLCIFLGVILDRIMDFGQIIPGYVGGRSSDYSRQSVCWSLMRSQFCESLIFNNQGNDGDPMR